MAAVAGLRGTGDWGTDERPKNFREGIMFYQRAGQSPIFALSSKAGKKTVDDPEFSWWTEPQASVRLQVNGALASGDTLVTVDSADPTTSTASVNWGNATHLKPGDILLVMPAADAASFTQEALRVENVISATQFTVSRGAAGTTPAAIADDRFLLLIGSAYAEGTGEPRATSRNPLKYTNYTQIFKESYEITGTADETNTRTGNAWSNDKKRKSFDHARAIEWSILFGRAAETVGTNGKPLRYMGGLRSFIPAANTTVFGAAVTPSTFLTAIAPVFDFNTGAGDERIAFVGNTALLELSKVFTAAAQWRIEGPIKVYGYDFQRFVTPLGSIFLRSHPLLNSDTITSKSMYIIDFDAFKYVAMRNRDTKTKDDIQTKGEDVRRGLIQTECSIMLDYGGLTCAYLGNISAT